MSSFTMQILGILIFVEDEDFFFLIALRLGPELAGGGHYNRGKQKLPSEPNTVTLNRNYAIWVSLASADLKVCNSVQDCTEKLFRIQTRFSSNVKYIHSAFLGCKSCLFFTLPPICSQFLSSLLSGWLTLLYVKRFTLWLVWMKTW